MKKSLFLFASIFALYSCQNKEEKLIIEHLQQDRIYDFEIIKSFPTDSLKTEWKPDNNTIRNLDELKRCVREINASGYNNIKITTDADYHIKSLEKIKDDKKLASDVKKWLQLWHEFKYYQDLVYEPKENFKPEFIGWKKVCIANINGKRTSIEFQFNKSRDKVIKYKELQSLLSRKSGQVGL